MAKSKQTASNPKVPAKATKSEKKTSEKKSEPEEEKPKQQRKQLAEIIDVIVSTARVRNNLSDNGVNASIRDALTEIEENTDLKTLSAETCTYACDAYEGIAKHEESVTAVYNAFASKDLKARDGLKVEETKAVLSNLVSRHLLRMGDDAISAFAATANYIVRELARHGAKSLQAESKKTLKNYHIANDEITDLSVWPFLRTLPCVAEEREAYHTRLAELERKKIEKKEKDKKKKAKAKADAAAGTSDENETVVEVDENVEKDDQSGDEKDDEKKEKVKRDKQPCDDFKHHAYQIARIVVKESVNGDVSSAVREFGSRVVYELINRYAKLIRLQTTFAGVKTVKAQTITTINSIILVDADKKNDDFTNYVDTRVNLYLAHVQRNKEEAVTAKEPVN
jgi:hypothetical protein